MTAGPFLAEFIRCILPPWMYLTTGPPTRSSACWTQLAEQPTATRPVPRRSSCGAPACGSPRSSSWSGGTSITRVSRRRCWFAGRRRGRPDGPAAPGAGAAVHQLAGEPDAARQGGGHQHEVGAAPHCRCGGGQRAGPGDARDREAAPRGSLVAPLGGPALAHGRAGSAERGQPVARACQCPGNSEGLPAYSRRGLLDGHGAIGTNSPFRSIARLHPSRLDISPASICSHV